MIAAIANGVGELKALGLVSETRAPLWGACRQVLSEFVSADFEILVAGPDGAWLRHDAAKLWPMMFGKDSLPSFGHA